MGSMFNRAIISLHNPDFLHFPLAQTCSNCAATSELAGSICVLLLQKEQKNKKKEKQNTSQFACPPRHTFFWINTAVIPAPIVERINQHRRCTQCKCIDPLPCVLLAVSTIDDGVLLFQPRTQSQFIFARRDHKHHGRSRVIVDTTRCGTVPFVFVFNINVFVLGID